MNASNAVYRSLFDRKGWAGYRDLDSSESFPTCSEAGDMDLRREPIQDAFSEASFDGSSIEVMFAGDSTGDIPDVVESAARLFPNLRVQLNHAPAEQRAAGLSGAVVTGLTAALWPYECVMNAGVQRDRSISSVHAGELLTPAYQGRGAFLDYSRLLRLIGPEYSRDPDYLAQASKEVRPARE